jgi:hypothetical protein
MDLPSQQTLREFLSLSVALIQTHMAVVQSVKPRITAYLQDYPSLFTDPARRILCIDAFSVGPMARVTDLTHRPSSYKNCFLFRLTPLDRRFRVVPLRLHPAPSGAASVATHQRVDQLIEEITRVDSRISLNFISVDGDEGYNEYFERVFNQVVGFIEEKKLGIEFGDFVLSIRLFWLSDWLHLVKNARVKLFGTRIVVNPQDVSGGATRDGIAGSFAKSPTFTDNSPLRKMRDCYPLDLFTLRRTYIRFVHRNNIDKFISASILGPWSETLEN